MMGYKDGRPGSPCFNSHNSFLYMLLALVCWDGLYYCPTDVFTIDPLPIWVTSAWVSTEATVLCVLNDRSQTAVRQPSRYEPTMKARQLESEVWLLRLGSPGVDQLNVLPQLTTSLPPIFEHHPFCFVDFKEQACIQKQAAQRSAVQTIDRQHQYYMDFGFMRASALDFS
jgi:hypothetical protein